MLCHPKIQWLLEYRPTMDPASCLFRLRQGNQPVEDYVIDFCELCHLVTFNDVALKDIFRHGLNEPIRSCLPGGKIHWSLEQYIDFALLLSGSVFTVRIADEETCNPTVPITPEHFHTPTFMSGIVDIMPETSHTKPKPAQVMSTKSAHVMPAKPQPALFTSAKPQPAHAMPGTRGPAHAMPSARGPVHAMPAIQGPAHAMPSAPGSAPVMAGLPTPVHKMAAIPTPVHKMAAIPKTVLKMATPSESPAKMAATPEPPYAKVTLPESHPVMSAIPQASQVMADPLV
ncbi:hypothetical protein M9458_017206, partial [Cirrhinus mrigala]